MNPRIIFFGFLLFVSGLLLRAQDITPVRIPIAPDFTMVSMDGDTLNLYSELNAGKIVVLDFFATGCPTCQQNTPKLDSIWQAYGYNGDSLWVWGIECSFGDSNYVNNINEFENNYGGQFPIFSTFANTDSVLSLYNITWTPQYYLICPDTKAKQPRMDISEIDSVIQACKQHLTPVKRPPTASALTIFYACGQLHISKLSGKKTTLNIYTQSGNLIFQKQITSVGKTTVPVSKLQSGVYIVVLAEDRKIIATKHFFK